MSRREELLNIFYPHPIPEDILLSIDEISLLTIKEVKHFEKVSKKNE